MLDFLLFQLLKLPLKKCFYPYCSNLQLYQQLLRVDYVTQGGIQIKKAQVASKGQQSINKCSINKWRAWLYFRSTIVIPVFSILLRKVLTIKVYGAAIVCTSHIFFIECFKWDVIEKAIFACRHNYNMQILLLFTTRPPIPLMRCDQKSPRLQSLGLGGNWWRQSWLEWTRAVNNYASIVTRVTQGQLAVHCLHCLIGFYGFLTKSCPENTLTMRQLWANVFVRQGQTLAWFVFIHRFKCHVQNMLQLQLTCAVIRSCHLTLTIIFIFN